MALVKLSRLLWLLLWLSVAAVSTGTKTLCDTDYCTCHDPYGRVHCACTTNNTQEVVLRSTGDLLLPYETSAVVVRGCAKVTVLQDALAGLKGLRSVELTDVKQLVLQPHAFRWLENGTALEELEGHGIRINLTRVMIQDVPSYCFGGKIKEVLLDACYVGMIRAYAFSNLGHVQRILLRNTNVGNTEAQAFKKFSTNKFLIVGSRLNILPSRFLTDMYIEDVFKIDSTFITEVRTLAFNVYNPVVTVVSNSHINVLQSEALRVFTRGDIIIEHTVFERVDADALRGLSVEKHVLQLKGKQKLRLHNVTMGDFTPRSLSVNESVFETTATRIALDATCTCDDLELWRGMVPSPHPIESTFWCRLDDKKEAQFDYVSGQEFYLSHCETLLASIHFFVIIVSATTVGILLAVLGFMCYVKQRHKWTSVPTSAPDHPTKGSKDSKNNNKKKKKKSLSEVVKPEQGNGMIVPDGRTYRETEFHVIVEKAEPLEEGFIPYRVTKDRSKTHLGES